MKIYGGQISLTLQVFPILFHNYFDNYSFERLTQCLFTLLNVIWAAISFYYLLLKVKKDL
jgi:hypothetical protein